MSALLYKIKFNNLLLRLRKKTEQLHEQEEILKIMQQRIIDYETYSVQNIRHLLDSIKNYEIELKINCVICYNQYFFDTWSYVEPCFHRFCNNCTVNLEKCPICRRSIKK